MTAPQKRTNRSFFAAADRSTGGPSDLTEKYLPFERARRQKLLGSAISDTEQLISALRAARPFDEKGNVEHAAVQITDALADVLSHTTNFLADVSAAGERLDRLHAAEPGEGADPAVAAEPSPQAPAAADTPPEPVPHLVSVQVFSPDESPSAQLEAFDRAAAVKAQGAPRPGNWIRASDAVGAALGAEANRARNEIVGAAARSAAQLHRGGRR